jgi:hypothetical protein
MAAVTEDEAVEVAAMAVVEEPIIGTTIITIVTLIKGAMN